MGMNKFKLKAVVAAIALGAAAQANANLLDGASGNGELFLSVWDSVAKVGYVKDTGILMSAYSTSVGAFNFNLNTDANWTAFLAASTATNTVWNIGALDSTGGANANGMHYLATSTNTLAQVKTQNNSGTTAMAGTNNYVSALNGLAGMSAVANGSVFVTPGDGNSYPGVDGGYWNNNFGTKAQGWTTTAALGEVMSMYLLTPSSTNGVAKANVTQCGYADVNAIFHACSFTLAANGTMTGAATSGEVLATPIPAALWLLGSAMVGLVGVARRKVA